LIAEMKKGIINKMITGFENKMAKKTKNKNITINAPLRNHRVGEVLSIEVDEKNIPLERYWRDRMKESKIDNCIEFTKGKK
tara:strand:- start:147 stop:389 length:243 start_codon:yes stop_codon:yes gene_type:complete